MFSPPLFPAVLLMTFLTSMQVHAHLRVINANGLTPVKDRARGRDRKPATPPSRPLITPQTQVTLVDKLLIHCLILWIHRKRNQLITCRSSELIPVQLLNQHVRSKCCWCRMFSLVFSGFYMRLNFSQGSTPSESRLQSPSLPPSSHYCQILWVTFVFDSKSYELLNAPHLPHLSATQLSSHSNTLPSFLPSFLNPGFTSTSVLWVLGHSECLCSKLRGVKQSCGHVVTTPSPIGLQRLCFSACNSSLIRCMLMLSLNPYAGDTEMCSLINPNKRVEKEKTNPVARALPRGKSYLGRFHKNL